MSNVVGLVVVGPPSLHVALESWPWFSTKARSMMLGLRLGPSVAVGGIGTERARLGNEWGDMRNEDE